MIDLKNKVNILIVINVVVYILTLYLSASTNLNVYQIFGANQALVLGNGEFYRIITSMFSAIVVTKMLVEMWLKYSNSHTKIVFEL